MNFKSLLLNKIIFDIDRIPCSCTSLKKITAKRRKLAKTFAGFHRDAINDKKLKPFNAWSHSSLSKIYACVNVAFRVRHIQRIFTHIFLTEEDDNESGKNLSWKVNWRCFQVHCSYSMSFNLSNVGEFFQELNSKGLFLCYEKHTTSLSCVHALHKTWNKAVTARHGGAACDSIKMYKKAWFACIVVVLLTAYINTFLTFAFPFSIWALSTLIHRSTRSHTTTGISMRFRQYTRSRYKTVEMLVT